MSKVFLIQLSIPYVKRSGIPHGRGATEGRKVWVWPSVARTSKPQSHLPFSSKHRLHVSPGAPLVAHVPAPAQFHPRMKKLFSYTGYPHDWLLPFHFPILTSAEYKAAVHLESLHTNIMPACLLSGPFLRVVMAICSGQ